MDYRKIAGDILDNVGGKQNVKSMTHCFTRLRFVLKDSKLADKAVVERLEGDFFNVMGLPLCALGNLLKQLGVDLI